VGRPVQEKTGLQALSGDKIAASRNTDDRRGNAIDETFRLKPAHIFGEENSADINGKGNQGRQAASGFGVLTETGP